MLPYASIESLQRDNAVCRRCGDAGFLDDPRPVFEGRPGQRAYLFGLAPGHVEEHDRRPWRGRAGRTLRGWLRLDEDAFYRMFYCASVTRCFPGKAAGGRGDRSATRVERELCAGWAAEELRLLEPDLIVTVGLVAAQALLGVDTLGAAVGKSFSRGEAIGIPLPHPSGASSWLNDAQNKARLGKALTHVRRELARIDAAS